MITLDNISFSYNEQPIFKSLNYTFQRDTVYFVQAPSGSGKTTLLNLCAQYLQPESGRVLADGAVEYLMQSELLFSALTVEQNLSIRYAAIGQTYEATGVDADQTPVSEAISCALSKVSLPGIQHKKMHQLSGGERRRVEIAGALLSAPSVLLLDEPVGSLDPDNARTVYESLWRIREGKAIVVVTHEAQLLNAPSDAVILHLSQTGLSTQERAQDAHV